MGNSLFACNKSVIKDNVWCGNSIFKSTHIHHFTYVYQLHLKKIIQKFKLNWVSLTSINILKISESA